MAEQEGKPNGLAVTEAEAGQKLLNFLRRRIDAPDGDLHRWIRTGQVRINGSRAKAFDRLETGGTVRIPPFAALRRGADAGAPSRGAGSVPELPPVVYEDGEIIVLAKPAGLPVQGGSGHSDSIASRLAAARAAADFVPAPVHRLDRDTSGLLVAGKTYASVRALTDAFAGRGGRPPHKVYLAWVEGFWREGEKTLRDFLAKDETAEKMVSVPPSEASSASAKEALCIVRPMERRSIGGRPHTLLSVELLTGRKHQIRVQLSSRGHPVAGDGRYGKKGKLMLHAWRLTIPREGMDDLDLELPPPWGGEWAVHHPA
ncbi:MAG: RluA family pseudouridine synthase [Mailhella sp.]|nr:RluA family pseudouridine synthase [Mailhella sp.]